MTALRHIAVYLPHGGIGDPGLQSAAALARRVGARMTLLSALPLDWRSHRASALRRFDQERLDDVAARLGRHVHTAVLDGPPPSSIRRAVAVREIDLLVKTARPRSFLDRVIGGVARDLLRQCPCPVWVVRANWRGDEAPIVAAIGAVGWSADPDDLELARQVLSVAADLAALHGRQLVVAHAWDPIAGRVVARSSSSELQTYLRDEEQHLRGDIAELLAGLEIEAEIALVRGEPAAAVADLAGRLGSEMIVVGNRGRSGLSGLLFGNTAERVIDAANTSSVLTVRAA